MATLSLARSPPRIVRRLSAWPRWVASRRRSFSISSLSTISAKQQRAIVCYRTICGSISSSGRASTYVSVEETRQRHCSRKRTHTSAMTVDLTGHRREKDLPNYRSGESLLQMDTLIDTGPPVTVKSSATILSSGSRTQAPLLTKNKRNKYTCKTHQDRKSSANA